MRLRRQDIPKVCWGTAQLYVAVWRPSTAATQHSVTLQPHLFTVQGCKKSSFLWDSYTQTSFTTLQGKASYVALTRRLPIFAQWQNTQRHTTKERRPQTLTKPITTVQNRRDVHWTDTGLRGRNGMGWARTALLTVYTPCPERHSTPSAALWLSYVPLTTSDVPQDKNCTYNVTMWRARIFTCTSASIIGNG